MPSRVGKDSQSGSTGGKPASILKGGNQSKGKSPVPGETAADTVVAGTPTTRGPSKAARPQGTSPSMARDTAQDDDFDILPLDIGLEDDEAALGTEDDQDSVARAIYSTRKELFASSLSKAANATTRSTRMWKPITPKDTPAQAEGGGKDDTFSARTVFHERSPTPTDGGNIASKPNVGVVRMRFKLQPCNVQKTLIGLLAHCLSVLHERDKSACILNKKMTLEAKKVSDFPRDFTDFYDEWGLWEEDITMFLNTIKDKGQRTFAASFYFRCSSDPAALFAKTLLKMAKQSQHKGSVSIEWKPCQYLDTTRDIIFFNLPFCDAVGLRDYIKSALIREKSRLIHRYPTEFPRKDWDQAFQDFEMVRDFVKNTPWRSREEKTTIPALHKLVWHLECPRKEVPFIYRILKVMEKNRSIHKLLGQNVKIMKNVGRDAPPSLKMELASYVHWHTAYQMSINHVVLRGLVNPDKRVELFRLVADGDGDAQESVITSVREILTKHKVDHLRLWQGMFQNDDGSWKGFYSNGKGCERHKGTATRWSGCPAAHLRFHLLKRGVTNDSALNLIRRSFTPQAFRDALQATFKDGKVVSADDLKDAKRTAPWVDITQGMEMSEKREHVLELQGRTPLLDPSNPEALNFNEEQFFKSLGTAGTNASMYTSNQSVSLGGTAFKPRENDDIVSQESPIFGSSDISKAEENTDDNTEGAFIENMGAFGLGSTNPPPPTERQEDSSNDMELERTQPGQPDDNMELYRTQPGNLILSPAKVTRTASLRSGFSTAISPDSQRQEIEAMIQQWVDANGSDNIPAHLADLAKRAQVTMSTFTTPRRRDNRDKSHPSTPSGADGAQKGILTGIRFVLTGVWPYQGSGQGLALGKERIKLRIEKFGRIVTMSISGIMGAWMCQNDHTDTELAYWIKKCLLFRGTRSFALLVTEGGFSSLDVRVAAVGQDRIGWTDFLHGKVSIEIASIQKFHCMSSPACRLTGNDWMKAIITHLLQMSHSQWIFCNYTLHGNEFATSAQSPCRQSMCCPKTPTRHQPHPTSTSADIASNKRYRKPD